MPRGWLVTLGLSVVVLAFAAVAAMTRTEAPPLGADAAADPCFSYGRFECCVRN